MCLRGDKSLRSIFIFIFCLGLSLSASVVHAQEVDFTEVGRGEDGVSYQNPQTFGEYAPRLTGKMNSVRLVTDNGSSVWTGLVHATRGMIQAWGDGLIQWEDESLEEMDARLKQFVDMNPSSFRVKSNDLVLSKTRTTFAGPFRTITYDRYFWMEDSVRFKVSKAFLTFRFKYNRLIQITNNTFGEVGIFEAPVIGVEDAILAASEDAMIEDGRDQVLSNIGIELQPFFIRSGDVRFRVVYQVGISKKNPSRYLQYSVSAGDGSVVQILDGNLSAVVTGEILPRLATDEVVTVGMPFLNISNRQGKDQTDANGEFSMDPSGAMGELFGAAVRLFVDGKTTPKASANDVGDIHFMASSSLDENNAYYHVTRINQFVQQFIQHKFLKTPIRVNTRVTNGPIKHCNAWYAPLSKDLNFLSAGTTAEGTSCESTARIADVVYHEWGHALDDALGGIHDGAFSEAIGDISSFLQTGDSRLAPTFFKGSEKPIRDVSVLKVFPKDRNRNPHAEGLIVGGAWWDFYSAMKTKYGADEGKMKTASIFYRHLVSTDTYMDSYQGALVTDDDDGDLSNCTPHMCLMNDAFVRHGLAQKDDRCGTKTCGSSTLYSED